LEAGVFNKFIYADRSTLNSTELYVGLPANSAVEKTNEEDDFKSFISEGKVSLVGTDKLSNIQIQEIPVLAVGLVRARLTVLCFCWIKMEQKIYKPSIFKGFFNSLLSVSCSHLLWPRANVYFLCNQRSTTTQIK